MQPVDLTGRRVLVTLPLTDEQKEDFRGIVEDAGGTVSFILEPQVTEADVADVTLVVGNVPARTLYAPESLQWLQTSSAGYDHYMVPGRLAAHTKLTNATGAYGQAVSEHMLASLLCLMKKLHLYRDNQRVSQWRDEGPVTSLVGARVLVMGTGNIGTAFARLVSALGSEVWGARRRTEDCPAPFTRMVTLDEVLSVLGEVDVVAGILPSTPETRLLANADFFAAMKPGAFFVNAGRGDLVDSDALVAALASGHLGGAALDVTNPEPLPADHPLWNEPHALVTPHISGFWHLQVTLDNVVAIARANLEAYLVGEPLKNVVNR